MTVLEGRYELGQRIGGGGMAEVVEARDRKLDRRVAVKFLRAGSADPRARERFVREAQVAASFAHPNVVSVFDVGEFERRPYLVMELVDGRSLAEILAERGRLPAEQAMAITDALLAALAAAHAQGLVHRDVKPGNVMVGRDGRVKLADFGIAKAAQEATGSLTATGQVMGTPTYLSPEQVEGVDATPRSDLYAVGVVLYEMLSGAPPFRAEHPFAVALAHRDSPVPPLDERGLGLPHGLTAVVERALAKDPEARFASAAEMRAALDGVRRGNGSDATVATTRPDVTRSLPAVAPAVPRERRARPQPKRTRHLPRGATALLLVVAVLLGAGAGVLIFRGGDQPSLRGSGVEGSSPLVSAPTPTLPTTTTTTLPSTIDGLIALLSANPALYGDKGDDLLNRLVSLQQHPDPRGNKSERTAAEISHWVQEGQLDPTIGNLALQILGANPTVPFARGRGDGGGD